jgi:mRNA degradation ribonuclease J1/J2
MGIISLDTSSGKPLTIQSMHEQSVSLRASFLLLLLFFLTLDTLNNLPSTQFHPKTPLKYRHGTIVHTGDWKIDETPVDGEHFDREYFEALGRDGVALMMSDSTNVLSPGRTTSEKDVEANLIRRVMGHAGKGRVVTTQFASNLHRLASVKKAADASGRKICFVGMSLNTYLQAAQREGMAPMDPRELVPQSAIEEMDPNELLIVTTGSQAEPRAALALAAREASHLLKLRSSDLVLYSAKVIPGNDTRVIQMMNRIAELGPEIAMGRDEGLHTSGHAYRDELEEALQHVKPQHFLPVHGEYAFLCAHAQLAKETGISNTAVIRNGQMLGVWERRNGRTVSTGSMAGLGEVALTNYYNDGNKGTGTAKEMGLEQRQLLAVEGLVIAAVDVVRDPRLIAAATTKAASMSGRTPSTTVTAATGAAAAAAAAAEELLPENVARRQLGARIRITTRAMWTDRGRLQAELFEAANSAIKKLPADATVQAVERSVTDALKRMCKVFNNRRPEIVVLVHEMDPRAGAAVDTINRRRRGGQQQGAGSSWDAAEALLREQQQQDNAFVRVDGVSAGNDKNKQQRRRKAQQDHQQREKDLLFAGRGGDVEELGTAVISDDSAEEEDADVAGGGQDGPGAASPAAGAGAGASGGGGKQRAVGGVPSVGDKISQRSRMAGRSGLMGAGSSSGAMRRTGGTRLPPLQRLDPEEMKRRQRRNPRDAPDEGGNVEYP